jgi:hypothetical protein
VKTSRITEKENFHYIEGHTSTPAGEVPRVAARLSFRDTLGAILVRWSVNRDNYKVNPGLYAMGTPTATSDVFVTANYKLSFDHLRRNLAGLNAWILVLDTHGINVWCAAGKGTFSTRELVNRIRITRLDEVVSHRRIIVPQLGAVGVSAHQVKKLTTPAVPSYLEKRTGTQPLSGMKLSLTGSVAQDGFSVIYGPVRAKDIKDFIRNRYVTTREMRKVTFNFSDRIRLVPVDFMYGKYKLLIAFAIFFILSGLSKKGISFQLALEAGPVAMVNILTAYVAGIVLTPMALPYIPGRSFALKGFIMGALVSALSLLLFHNGRNELDLVSWFLIMCGISSFTAMNFTGSSTYTSLSGVKKEMKVAIPLQLGFSTLGVILFILGKFI